MLFAENESAPRDSARRKTYFKALHTLSVAFFFHPVYETPVQGICVRFRWVAFTGANGTSEKVQRHKLYLPNRVKEEEGKIM
jgi:hypothetical protein